MEKIFPVIAEVLPFDLVLESQRESALCSLPPGPIFLPHLGEDSNPDPVTLHPSRTRPQKPTDGAVSGKFVNKWRENINARKISG